MSKISKIIGPLGLFIFYIAVSIFIRSKFSDTASFIKTIENIYANFGYPLIFFGAFLESMFLIGLLVPGSVVLLTGAALSRTGVIDFPYVFILGTSGLITGYAVNYFLGKYGWYHILFFLGLQKGVDAGKHKLKKQGIKTLFLGYFFPGSGSLFSTASGILKMDFKKFILVSVAAQCFWSLVWGVIAYFFGIELVGFIIKYFVFVVLGIAAVWGIKRFVLKI